MPDFINPHFDLPFRFGATGSAVCVEQDSTENIENAVEAVFRTTIGQRLELPEFGVPDQAFTENGPDLNAYAAALDKWEPRASALLTSASPIAEDQSYFRVTAEVPENRGLDG